VCPSSKTAHEAAPELEAFSRRERASEEAKRKPAAEILSEPKGESKDLANSLFRNTFHISPWRSRLCEEIRAKVLIPIDRGGEGGTPGSVPILLTTEG
jgi:hypothetical protein